MMKQIKLKHNEAASNTLTGGMPDRFYIEFRIILTNLYKMEDKCNRLHVLTIKYLILLSTYFQVNASKERLTVQ